MVNLSTVETVVSDVTKLLSKVASDLHSGILHQIEQGAVSEAEKLLAPLSHTLDALMSSVERDLNLTPGTVKPAVEAATSVTAGSLDLMTPPTTVPTTTTNEQPTTPAMAAALFPPPENVTQASGVSDTAPYTGSAPPTS